ncbi:DUF2752 domain-containing protein [Angustibacter peucedani]
MSTATERAAPPRTGWRGALGPVGAAAAAAAVTAYVGAVDPGTAGHYPTCPFLLLTGAYCPGCGSLRAMHALAHGDVATALARNPLTVACSLALVVLWAGWLRRSLSGAPRRLAPAWVIYAFLGVVLAFWVLRNLPGFAFLAP